MCLTEEHWV